MCVICRVYLPAYRIRAIEKVCQGKEEDALQGEKEDVGSNKGSRPRRRDIRGPRKTKAGSH